MFLFFSRSHKRRWKWISFSLAATSPYIHLALILFSKKAYLAYYIYLAAPTDKNKRACVCVCVTYFQVVVFYFSSLLWNVCESVLRTPFIKLSLSFLQPLWVRCKELLLADGAIGLIHGKGCGCNKYKEFYRMRLWGSLLNELYVVRWNFNIFFVHIIFLKYLIILPNFFFLFLSRLEFVKINCFEWRLKFLKSTHWIGCL